MVGIILASGLGGAGAYIPSCWVSVTVHSDCWGILGNINGLTPVSIEPLSVPLTLKAVFPRIHFFVCVCGGAAKGMEGRSEESH